MFGASVANLVISLPAVWPGLSKYAASWVENTVMVEYGRYQLPGREWSGRTGHGTWAADSQRRARHRLTEFLFFCVMYACNHNHNYCTATVQGTVGSYFKMVGSRTELPAHRRQLEDHRAHSDGSEADNSHAQTMHHIRAPRSEGECLRIGYEYGWFNQKYSLE